MAPGLLTISRLIDPGELERAAEQLPLQQRQALIGVRDLLVRLSRPELSPRVPLEIRREARALLRHYPFRRDSTA